MRYAASAVLAALLTQASAHGATCPPVLIDARRLVLVTATNMATPVATLQLFERDATDQPWRAVRAAEPAVVGQAGMAWGLPFRGLAHEGEPMKVEGDKRTPAGVYPVGRSFGFSASPRKNHLRLTADTVCVDDLASPAYNTITTRTAVGRKVGGEDMRRINVYRRGLVIDYPSDRAAKAGSCIFVHVWRAPGRGTAGCVALPEARVAALLDFADGVDTAIAILPQAARDRFAGCVPEAATGKTP